MNCWNLTIYTLIFSLSSFFSTHYIEAEITDRSTGQSFPDTQTIQFDGSDHTLQATGVATRKKFFVKVYSVAHYMENAKQETRDAIFEEILNSNNPKQLYLKWLRSASGKKVQDGYRDSFKTVNANGGLQSAIAEYIGFFSGGVKSGDTHILTWLPDGTIEVSINGQSMGSIKDQDFARALWSIWFGPKSVVNRNDLVSYIR